MKVELLDGRIIDNVRMLMDNGTGTLTVGHFTTGAGKDKSTVEHIPKKDIKMVIMN